MRILKSGRSGRIPALILAGLVLSAAHLRADPIGDPAEGPLSSGVSGTPGADPRPARAPGSPFVPAPPAPGSGDVGALCGADDIIGQRLSPIRGDLPGCRINHPVRVARIGGLKLSRPTTLDCTTAVALRSWVGVGVQPVLAQFGWEAERLEVAGGYACKRVNNRPRGALSEHALGRAVDVTGIGLTNGHTITVRDGWNRRLEGQVLRRLHRAACGRFRTVLGPDADRYHRAHFHLGTGLHARPDPLCR